MTVLMHREPVLIRGALVDGTVVDVRTDGHRITEVAPRLELHDETVLAAEAATLHPGFHDHHLHLMAMAAARRSIDCSAGIEPLASAPGTGWLRGFGLSESLDRWALDAVVADRPVRVQHASGSMWMLNSAALAEVHLDDTGDVERDAAGVPTGRLWRYDERLRASLPNQDPRADLIETVRECRLLGITSATDATPDLDRSAVALLNGLGFDLTLLGDPFGSAPVKIVLADHRLPDYDELCRRVQAAHQDDRGVACHVLTRTSLVLLAAVFDQVGRHRDDRIEHAAVVPDVELLRGVRVVTQPGFIADRGHRYRADVHPDDLTCLYRYRTLVEAGIEVLPSSDAPYGPLDPQVVVAAATQRLDPTGVVVGAGERVAADTVLDGYWRDAGGRRRLVAPGQPAALVMGAVGQTPDVVLSC